MNIRTSTDGLPYYCKLCGLGWSEFCACEEWFCELETVECALARAVPTLPPTPQIGDYSNIMEE